MGYVQGAGFSRRKPSAKVDEQEVPLEDDEQIMFVVWLKKRLILHFAVMNGSKRSLAYAAKCKRMGLAAGVPDLIIPVPNGQYHGLAIEMKRTKGGVTSESQRFWLDALKLNGWQAVIARGCKEAIRLTEEYFADTKKS
jgi:hypothetical protein